jgi:uncharacterized BrkB/YihY/UPF0761 family membrane protein
MTNTLISVVSIAFVIALAFFIASRFKLSTIYERKPPQQSSWSRKDMGEDPSTDGKRP